jgi:hypothetical protein
MGRWSNSLSAREAVSSAQLVPCPRFNHLFRRGELSVILPSSGLVVSRPAESSRLLVDFSEEPVCRTQHAIPSDFILLSQGVPHLQ